MSGAPVTLLPSLQFKESALRKQSLYLKFDPLLQDSPRGPAPVAPEPSRCAAARPCDDGSTLPQGGGQRQWPGPSCPGRARKQVCKRVCALLCPCSPSDSRGGQPDGLHGPRVQNIDPVALGESPGRPLRTQTACVFSSGLSARDTDAHSSGSPPEAQLLDLDFTGAPDVPVSGSSPLGCKETLVLMARLSCTVDLKA